MSEREPAWNDAPQAGSERPPGVSRLDLRRLKVAVRVGLPVIASSLGALVLIGLLWASGGELRSSWADMRRVNDRRDQLVALELATSRLNREVKSFLDSPDETRRAEVETMKSSFTGELWRVRDGAEPSDSEDVEDFSSAARRYLIGFDDLRGLEIDVALLYDGDFADLIAAIRRRLDALDLAIRPGDVELRPLVARAYDRFAALQIHLGAYRRDRNVDQIGEARQARDDFEAAIVAIGRSPAPDSRGYAVEMFAPHLAALDELLQRLVAISWRKSLWLSGYVDGNRDTMTEALTRLLDRQRGREKAALDHFEALLVGLTWRLVAVVALSLAFALWVVGRVARSISCPLAEQTVALRAVVGGLHDRPVPSLDAPDEIGDAARALEVFRREVADRRRREEDHDIQERRWLSILETSPIAIAILSAETGRLIFANRRWRDLLPAARDDAVETGNDLADRFVDPAQAGTLAAAVARRDGVTAWAAELRRPDGASWWALIEIRPIDFAGRPAHILWLYDDTEGRRAEEAVGEARDRAEAALVRLARAQDELVEAEKLAAIGGLVAGVAHEVNNPVGIGLTVASTLDARARAFAAEVAAGGLRRSRLDDFVAGVADASKQLVANLTRAADLVLAFKQVAVDRTHPDRRGFDLAEATEQIVASLRPGLRATPHRLDVAVPEGLAMEGYPGAWGQILTNLFVNALTHAFTEGRSGGMTIEARALGEDRVVVTFADDGVGMDAETARRAFEPFFTTRRGRGGSGLGLHIVRTLVVNRMGGRIRIVTAPGEGCRFEMTMPRVAPDDPVAPRDEGEGYDARWSTTT
ncbi:sensor histidine kinase [Pinisolibacter aquiterrae]|uniref:sensor histidine kinase n=1 Tax=Pinisolibacter aquiterrae TaxID=2815579 RepID=UPI001E2CF0EF|nr:PAS domain-containing sensor histidine kinase [Pinisolibacter aquiterrae]MCC8233648.1 hypothetical protein [Pinisolibacter aquiterrae]